MTNLSDWCKSVKKELIEREWTVNKLSEESGLNRVYVSSVINGRVISPNAQKRISDVLNIPY